MKFIVPFGLHPESPNPLLTREQDTLLYLAHLEKHWPILITLQLWQVIYGETGRYVRECIESELDHAFIDHFETHNRLEDYNERMSAHQVIDKHHEEFVQMIYQIYHKLSPYIGALPCRPSVEILESFDVASHGHTAMVIEMKFESEYGDGL